MWQMIINGPGYFDTAYDLPEGATTLGRADENDIVLSGDLVSRKHARVFVQGDNLTMEDVGSRNGTRINGESVRGKIALRPGDFVSIGENQLAIRQPATVENARTEVVDAGAGGVKRFGHGQDIASAVILAKDVSASVLLRILDNVSPGVVRTESPRASPLEDAQGDTGKEPSPLSFNSLLLLYQTVERLSQADSLHLFLNDVTDRLLQRVSATTAVVLVRSSGGAMVPAAVRHRGQLDQGEVPVSDAVVEAALGQGKALAVADVRDDERFAHRESVVLYGVDQVLCVPIGQTAPYAGVLYLNRSEEAPGEVEALLDLCTAVAHLLAAGIEKFSHRDASGSGRLRASLERFHPPEVVERRLGELAKAPPPKTPSLEERHLSVLFADLGELTALSQALPPAEVAELLTEFYRRVTNVIFSFEGTVDKYLGDAVMAVFGSPYPQPDHALRAVRAGLALKAEWQKVMARRTPRERCPLKVGVHSGLGLIGMLGTTNRVEHTTLGQVVSLASWLSASANAGQVLVTAPTFSALGERFEVSPLGSRLLGGKQKLEVYDILEEDPGANTRPGHR